MTDLPDTQEELAALIHKILDEREAQKAAEDAKRSGPKNYIWITMSDVQTAKLNCTCGWDSRARPETALGQADGHNQAVHGGKYPVRDGR